MIFVTNLNQMAASLFVKVQGMRFGIALKLVLNIQSQGIKAKSYQRGLNVRQDGYLVYKHGRGVIPTLFT